MEFCLRCDKHKATANGLCKQCKGLGRRRIWQREKLKNDPEYHARQLEIKNKWQTKLFTELHAAYGDGKCACCGETEPLFLELDHIENNGAEHLRSLGLDRSNNVKLYTHLRKLGFPPGFQILCANCNRGKFRNHGTCPHKKL